MTSSFLQLTEDDLFDIHREHRVGASLSREDAELSYNVPLVVNYSLVDTGVTDYGFNQTFDHRDTEMYFKSMKEFCGRTINDIIDECDYTLHFHRSMVKGKVLSLLKQLDAMCRPDESTIIYHFALYTTRGDASRSTGSRSPRVYFMLGSNGVIFPLFFDPYHEINPMPQE